MLGDFDNLALGPPLAIDTDDPGDALSPCSTLSISLAARNRSTPPSSGTRKPNPSGCPTMRPRTRSALSGISQSPRRFCINCASRAMAPRRRWNGSNSFERLNIEQFHQASEFQRRTLCCEGLQDVFAARQRMLVLAPFRARTEDRRGEFLKACGCYSACLTIWVFPLEFAPRFAPAQVAELVDALVSGTSAARRGGSSPFLGTKHVTRNEKSKGRRIFPVALFFGPFLIRTGASRRWFLAVRSGGNHVDRHVRTSSSMRLM
jgi:hypothetical protein